MPLTETASGIDYRARYEGLLARLEAQEALIAELRAGQGAGTRRAAPFGNAAYEYLTNLQYKARSLGIQLESFKSGQKYTDMRAAHKAQIAAKDREIERLKRDLADARAQVSAVRCGWEQVFDDMEKEQGKELAKKDRKIKEAETRTIKAEAQRDEARDRVKGALTELYAVRTELEDERGRNQKLTAQINRDHENSSIPSSQKPNRKKIANNREKTGRSPGGQPGHKGHPRKKHTATETIEIPAPEKYADSPHYVRTGRVISKQLVGIEIRLNVIEYSTPELRNRLTSQRVHADFPEGLVNEVEYDGSVKALAFLLNNHCNVSVAKVSELIAELTGGELRMSTGMINGLSAEFSQKTAGEQKKAFADLLLSPAMNADFTTVKVNGQNRQVLVCATPSTALYFAREHKGHEGVKDTPVEEYQHTMVSDHDATFRKYGTARQECLEHILRYLKDSMENEPGLRWNRRMRALIRKMIHFRKHLDPDDERDPDQIDPDRVALFEAAYDEILHLARDEYEYEPPSKYYKEGYNLYKRLVAFKDDNLLFLHDRRVPWTNNLAERLLRILKRKYKQMMTFRSDGGLDSLCDSLGVVATLRATGGSLFEGVATVFGRLKNPESKDAG